jgi:PAS domain S-box-containing protein
MSSQMVVAIFLVALLVSLHTRLRQQDFHKWWIAGWTMFALFLGLGRVALAFPPQWTVAKTTTVFLTTLVGFLMVPPLIFGAISFRRPGSITRRGAQGAFVVAAAVAIAAFLASSSYQSIPLLSFSLRHAPRTLFLSAALFFCAWVFFDRLRLTGSRAALVTGLSCVAYAIDQSIYTGAQLSVLFGGPAAAAEGFGRANLMASATLLYVDLGLMCGLCLGMVLLLVEEHRRAERALAESTERYQTERAIRLSDQRFAAVFRSNPCAMAIMSLEDDRFLDVNGTFERTSGFTRAELLGRTTLELGMWIDETERTALLARLMVDGRFQAAEVRFRQKNGRTAVVVFSAEIIELAGERCVVLAGLDVTAIQDVEARHKAILQALPDWVFLTTSDGTFLEFHARDQRHLVMPPSEFLHRNVLDVLPHDLAVRLMNCFSQALRSREPATVEYFLDVGPERRFYEVRAVPSDPDRVLSLVRDVTDQMRAEQRVRELQEELAHTGRAMALGALTGSLAHEINQPLSAINNNAHAALLLLENAPFDPVALRETIDDIVSDNQRIDDVLRRLRELLRKERRDYALVDLNSIVTDVLALLRSSFIERRIVVEMAMEPHLPAVHGDRVQLQQVVLNILMNAADAVSAMPDAAGRTVTITTAVAGPTVSVAVADKGVGISDEHLARMFDPFFTTKANGMGLGLSICRTIMDAHGGRIEAARQGQGLTCLFSLEAAQHKEPKAPMAHRPLTAAAVSAREFGA